jgi:ubiquinone/menaquinone biosynthesis C-methylase UbiE
MTTHTHAAAPQTAGRTIRWAGHYDLMVKLMLLGRDRSLRRSTLELAQLQPGESVLDVGCGTGDLTLLAKATVGLTGTVCGIDAAPEMIEVARHKATRAGAKIDFRVEPIEALTFPDRSFDVVVSSLMMHHLPDDVKRQGLAEIARVLKPGGRLMIVDMKRPTSRLGHWLSAVALHRNMPVGAQDLSGWLQAAGFTHIEAGNTRHWLLGYVRGRAKSVPE